MQILSDEIGEVSLYIGSSDEEVTEDDEAEQKEAKPNCVAHEQFEHDASHGVAKDKRTCFSRRCSSVHPVVDTRVNADACTPSPHR